MWCPKYFKNLYNTKENKLFVFLFNKNGSDLSFFNKVFNWCFFQFLESYGKYIQNNKEQFIFKKYINCTWLNY